MSAMPPMWVVTSGAPSAIASRTVVGHGSGHLRGQHGGAGMGEPGDDPVVVPLLLGAGAPGQ